MTNETMIQEQILDIYNDIRIMRDDIQWLTDNISTLIARLEEANTANLATDPVDPKDVAIGDDWRSPRT